jgi:membrane-associated phospholipid phosphatase
MPTILFVILFYFTSFLGTSLSKQSMFYVLIIIFTTTFVLPLFCVTVLKLTHNISSFNLENRKERFLPFFFICLFYAINSYLFLTKIKIGDVFIVIFMGITAIIFLLTLITFFWKISAQSTAISGTIGFLLGISWKYPQDKLLIPLVLLILMAGILMSSRLYLNANRPKEILGGSLLGLFVSFGTIYFFI